MRKDKENEAKKKSSDEYKTKAETNTRDSKHNMEEMVKAKKKEIADYEQEWRDN